MEKRFIYPLSYLLLISPVYSTIPSYVGDLVARDLKGAGFLGHVGIASAPDYRMRPTVVLEAMDTAPHIQENTISNFKSRSKYWGSKGGLLSPRSQESYTVANRIVRQYYACPEYTITWRWKEGKINGNAKPISCGQFRCDTLVNYAYAFSPGYSLPTYNTTWTTPLAIYNYFPVDSDLLVPEHITTPSDSFTTNFNSNVSSINEENLKELNSEIFYKMLQNSPNLSKEEISNLWKLLASKKVDEEIRLLFYDFLSFENPSYLTSEIIKQAKKETGELRHKLLVVLQSIYQENLEKSNEKELKLILNYFKKLQSEDLDKNDGGIVYRGLATLEKKNLDVKNANLTNMDKIHVNILRLRNDRINEKKYVAEIIRNLNNPDDSLLVTASYQYLTQLLIDSNLKFFSDESKSLFRKHLNNKKVVNGQQSILYTSAYIQFKAALNANNCEEVSMLVNKYVQLLDYKTQEPTLNGLTDFAKCIKN